MAYGSAVENNLPSLLIVIYHKVKLSNRAYQFLRNRAIS